MTDDTRGEPINVELSQDELYFLVPYATAVVENMLDIRNTMKPAGSGGAIVTYKVLSTVQGRYGISDPVGVIAPSSSATLRITLDQKALTSSTPSPLIPDKGTTDTLYFDFCRVPPGTVLSNGHDAAKFWRERGPVRMRPGGGGEESGLRVRIPCRFLAREDLPAHLQLRHITAAPSALVRRGGGPARSPKGAGRVQVRTPQEEMEEKRVRFGSADNGAEGGRSATTASLADDANGTESSLRRRVLSYRFPVPLAVFFIALSLLCGFVDEANTIALLRLH